MAVTICNDVLGPIMRGPSSGHTAANWRMGNMARQLAGGSPDFVECRFDKKGAYANVYSQHKSDLAFTAGLLNIAFTDSLYDQAFEQAALDGIAVHFTTPELAGAAHPNEVEVVIRGAGKERVLRFRSLGGGIASCIRIDGFTTHYIGDSHAVFCILPAADAGPAAELAKKAGAVVTTTERDGRAFLDARFLSQEDGAFVRSVRSAFPSADVCGISPLLFVPVMDSDQDLIDHMLSPEKDYSRSLAALARHYESRVLGVPADRLDTYLEQCQDVMTAAVRNGLAQTNPFAMRLMPPLAGTIARNLREKGSPLGGIHAKAAGHAIAAAEWNAAGGLMCAAPTAGAGGVLPAMLVIMEQDLGLSRRERIQALWTAGAIGLIIADIYTFSGAVGGCQVEIGTAGAMAAAAFAEAELRSRHGMEERPGIRAVALNAATLFLQNNLGLACDSVKGYVEIPCISRNATAITGAMVSAELALAGWKNPLGFKDTVLAMKDTGNRMPSELRCTAIGGLASRPCAELARETPSVKSV